MLRQFNINPLFFSEFDNSDLTFFRKLNMNSLSFSGNSYFVSRIHYKFSIFFVNSIWIPYFFREITMDLLFFRFDVENSDFFANWLCIHRLLGEITIFSANILWIHYLFRLLTLKSPSFSWNNYLFGDFTLTSLSVSLTHYEFTLFLSLILKLLLVYKFFNVYFRPRIRPEIDVFRIKTSYLSFNMHTAYGYLVYRHGRDFWPQYDLFGPQNDLLCPLDDLGWPFYSRH